MFVPTWAVGIIITLILAGLGVLVNLTVKLTTALDRLDEATKRIEKIEARIEKITEIEKQVDRHSMRLKSLEKQTDKLEGTTGKFHVVTE